MYTPSHNDYECSREQGRFSMDFNQFYHGNEFFTLISIGIIYYENVELHSYFENTKKFYVLLFGEF